MPEKPLARSLVCRNCHTSLDCEKRLVLTEEVSDGSWGRGSSEEGPLLPLPTLCWRPGGKITGGGRQGASQGQPPSCSSFPRWS